ncbi:MAG TPA: LysR substrate-binding domain-containing protein [Burkholderiaceae bacterium]|nr:LysR substrate-binding domain-containing protein [Burkholderiaceae bacterium]
MPLTRYTIRQLEAFVAVAEARGISAAAGRLGLSAQAVSQLVAELEGHVGFRLFDRTTRSVTLTSSGRDFLAAAETALRHLQAAEGAAADIRDRASGVVRVGAPLVLAATALPEAIAAYRATRPKVVVRISDVAVDALVESVAAGDVELAIGPDRSVGDDVSREPLFESPWVLWCARSHPLATRPRLTWKDLHGHALVSAGRDHERSVAQMMLTQPEDSRVMPVDVVDNTTAALGIAAQGIAATLAPAYVAVVADTMGLVMRRVRGPETIRTVCLYRRSNRALSAAAEGVAEHLLAWLPAWAAQRPPGADD